MKSKNVRTFITIASVFVAIIAVLYAFRQQAIAVNGVRLAATNQALAKKAAEQLSAVNTEQKRQFNLDLALLQRELENCRSGKSSK